MIQHVTLGEQDKQELQNTSVDPATQIDDHFDYSKVVVKKPWGYEYLMYQNRYVAVWILYIKQGFQTSMHCHPHKKTSLVVLSGEARCSSLHGDVVRTTGQGMLIEKGVFHRTHSVSDSGIFVMEIETPVNKRDLVRLQDSYGRKGKGYESMDDMSFNVQNYNYISLIDSEVYYNAKKKFGSCSISLAKYTTYGDFKENFHLQGWDAVSILKGKILDEHNATILDVGDTIDIERIRQFNDIHIEDEIEVIIIKKDDALVKLSDLVISVFEKNNVKDIFIVPGSTNVHLLDSTGRNTDIRHICPQTEQAATIAAEAYAKLTGTIGVAIISSGSGAMNALPGVADAWVDSTPMLILSGQSAQRKPGMRQLGVQELDVVSMVKTITKYAISIDDPTSIQYHIEKAIHIATSGRPGPVWIDLPITMQGMRINEQELQKFHPPLTQKALASDATILQTIDILHNANKPVLILGNGIRISKADQELEKLLSVLAIPVLTSRRGADLLSEDHEHYFGRPGGYGQRAANTIIQNADLILSIGCRLSIPQIGRNIEEFAPTAIKIVVDIDETELDKPTVKPDIAIQSDAGLFMDALAKKMKVHRPDWIEQCKKWKETMPITESIKPSENVNAYHFMQTLARHAGEDAVLTIDGGTSIIYAMQMFSFKKGQRLLSATGLENPNFAIPAAIGASVAKNRQPIICICDDRGFQKMMQEIETIANYSLPMTIFVLNNKGYSSIRKTQKEYFGGRYVASDKQADVEKIASAFNVPCITMNTNEEVNAKMQEVLQKELLICNVTIDENQEIIPRITFTVTADGKWKANPLDRMSPEADK